MAMRRDHWRARIVAGNRQICLGLAVTFRQTLCYAMLTLRKAPA